MAPQARDPNTTLRKIYFYHVDVGRDPETNDRIAFDAAAALAPLAALDFAAGDAYHEVEERVTCGWLDRTADPVRVRVADIRRTNLPQLEAAGALTRLEIDERAGLAEQVHIQFFPDNIAGSEFNFYGPRMTRVAGFLRAKLGLDIGFLPAIRGSAVEQLERLDGVRLFQLSITPALIDEVGRTDPTLASMFRSAREFGQGERLEVVIRPRKYGREPLGERVRESMLGLVRSPRILDGADVFRTAGSEGGRRVELNLLQDDLRVERPVRRLGDGSRALDPASVYAAIESAYDELRDELARARGLRIERPDGGDLDG